MFTAINSGPRFPQSEAVTFMVHCGMQEEIDRIWDALMPMKKVEIGALPAAASA